MDVKLQMKKVVRVFVSSTFRDFTGERDVLGKVVFPKLRRFCAGRGLSLTEVDLRWGVTEEMLLKGETITTCLHEVSLCAPFFIALLGERYGWHLPPPHPTATTDAAVSAGTAGDPSSGDILLTQALDAAQSQFPFVSELRDRSVTELEIRHALRYVSQPGHESRKSCMFFYLRDPAVVQRMPESEKHLFVPESDYAKEKLDILKRDVKNSGCLTRENYSDLEELGNHIYDDLCGAIAQHHPIVETLSQPEKNMHQQMSHASLLANFFAGRAEVMSALTSHVKGDVPYGKLSWSVSVASELHHFLAILIN
jgi:hypothetical protein